jgi:hypothetical protein
MLALPADLRLAAHALRRSPAFAAVSVLSVAVGIGANVAVFSVVDALLLRPLPVPEAERLVRVGRTTREGRFGPVSLPEYRELRAAAAGSAVLIGNYPNSAILTVRSEPRPVWLEVVTANYFSALGVRPLLGRGFGPDDDRAPNASPVLVISHALWRTRFNADPSVVGAPVRLNGRDFTVVGVAPPSFRGTFAGFNIDAWVPVAMQPVAVPGAGSIENREDRFLMLIGGLRPGVTAERARAALAAARPTLSQDGPSDGASEEERTLLTRGRKLARFLAQPMDVAEPYTTRPGVHVPLPETLRGCAAILDGAADHLPEGALYFIGGLGDAGPS